MILVLGRVYVPRWTPLFGDFLLIGRKLEMLGFVYSRGNVIIIEPEEISAFKKIRNWHDSSICYTADWILS